MKDRYIILMIGNFLSIHSRSRSVCEDLAEHLTESGWKVLTASNKLGRFERIMDMISLAWSKRNEYKIATIDTFSGPSFIWAEMTGFILKTLKKPYILSLHGGNLPDFAKRWPGRVTWLLKSAAVVTVPSRYLLENMKSYRSDLLLLPNPIDIAKYQFAIRNKPRPILMWLRAFEDIYNAPLAVQVAKVLIPDHNHFKLYMGGADHGDGKLEKVMQLAKNLDISDYVEFAGKISKSDVPEWLQQGDIFINTTNLDNTPVSILEAMACGLCIISTRVGGIPYLLDDEIDCLMVPPNDPVAMANAVHRVLTAPGLSKRLSENARKKVEQFDWAILLPRWENLLSVTADIF